VADIAARSFDHVALWVTERDRIAQLLCDGLAMHEIERTDDFTLAGVDALEGKITLFDAEGPRDPGVLRRIVLRVPDLEAATESLAALTDVEHDGGVATFGAPDGLGMGLVEADGVPYDLDHVVLAVPDPEGAAAGLADLGFTRRDGVLAVADRTVRLVEGPAADPERPLLNHLALLVSSAEEVRREAEGRGLEINKVVDAENTLAVFVQGPQGIVVEYVEHKPGFSLR
jgi:catechol 2,3-dioxygenase-like lactoylglutathione lyase family enzyme